METVTEVVLGSAGGEEEGQLGYTVYGLKQRQQKLQMRPSHVCQSFFFFFFIASFYSQRLHPCLQFLLARFPSLVLHLSV